MKRLRPPDLLVLLVFAGISVWLGERRSRLAVDAENVAMLSDRTPEAQADARRDELFGKNSTLLLLLEAPDGPVPGGADGASAAEWLDAVRAVPLVVAARALPAAPPGGGVLAAAELAPDPSDHQSFAPAIDQVLVAARGAAPLGARVSATGLVAGQLAISSALRREEARVLPILAVALALVLLAVYRSPALVAAAFLPAAGAVLWLGGLQELVGIALDPVAALLPPTLLTVGVAGAVHVLEGYLSEREQGTAASAAPAAALRHLALPLALAAATTVAGLLILAGNEMPAVRRFGVFASVGVAIAAVLNVCVVPAWLRVFAPRLHERRGRTWNRLARPLAERIAGRAVPLVVGCAAVGLTALFAWTRIAVDSDPLRILPEDHSFRVDTDHIASELGGIETFDLVLEAPHPPAQPLALASLASALSSLPGVIGPAGGPRRAASGEWLVPALLEPGGNAQRDTAFTAALQKAKAAGWEHAEVAGLAVRVARDSQRLVRGQLSGLLVETLLIGGLIVLGLRSLRLGVLALTPNLFACALVYGALAALGRPLTVASAMIGTVFLGLVIDDTVYLLHAVERERERGATTLDAVAAVLRSVGRPIAITSLTLGTGFAACLTGSLSTTREFGALAAAIVAASCAACLFLVPALVLCGARERA